MKRLVLIALAALILAVVMLGVTTAPAAAASDCDYWGMHFTYERPAGYWSPGYHTYEYKLYDAAAGWSEYFFRDFNSVAGTPIYYGQVFLRFYGLVSSGSTVTTIDPSQDTLFQVSWMLSTDYAEASTLRAGLKTWLRWDGGSWIMVKPSKLMPWCEISPVNPYFWTRNWMLDY